MQFATGTIFATGTYIAKAVALANPAALASTHHHSPVMAMPATFHHPSGLLAPTVLSVLLAVLVAGAEGRHHLHCPSFSCGHLGDVSPPFRRRGDPPGCGVQSYELNCTDARATIRIGRATYDVVSIKHRRSIFQVIEADLGTESSCLLPWWDSDLHLSEDRTSIELEPLGTTRATFVNCSRPIENNDRYRPVTCLSTDSSFVYVLTGRFSSVAHYFEPLCGYLAMTPLDDGPENLSYADVVKHIRSGFYLQFPYSSWGIRDGIGECMRLQLGVASQYEPAYSSGNRVIWEILFIDLVFWSCVLEQFHGPAELLLGGVFITAMPAQRCIAVLCRFVLMPLIVLTFLAHKYWKTRVTTSAVEMFLRMQQMLGGPTRYAYTDITAITGHFRDKLGQGGYGSVYKGVLLPGGIHVAVKMLGSSSCKGDEFISEVATIGRIHHVNVVRLVGYCSEEMRRALVYEYMPRGSLDKYIFSSEKSLSWEKLAEIALGIARGICYLHQGCDMQILHFDIKPHNILLNDSFVPKVADFGLAKLYARDDSFVPVSAARGTIGYIAPEMISRSFGAISSKSDVYSFGMLLLEMAGGRRNADPHAASSSQAYYPSLVYRRLARQAVGVSEISDEVEMHELEKKLCMVGLWCIQMRPHDRPTMSDVVEMLEAGVEGMAMPSRPFFCDDEHVPAAMGSYYMSSELDTIEEDDIE